MKKLLFLFCCLLALNAWSQDTTEDKTAGIDSAAILSDLMDLLDSADVSSSYAMVSAGIGNRLFSIRNQQLNAKQSSSSTMVYSPAIGYFHKSGLSLTAGASLLKDINKGFRATQFSVSPSFDWTADKNWSAGISYTRYFITDKYSSYSSPIQNDWYAYASYKKWWLEPGLAAGFSNGNFTEIFKFKTLNGVLHVDTGTYKLTAFSMIASVSHDFEWSSVLGKGDDFSITPTLMINFGSDSTKSLSHTIAPALLRFLSKRRRFPKLQGQNSFAASSLGLSIDMNYSIGKFSLMPQVYLDYYLPATEEKRFTQNFSLTAAYTF